MSEKPDALRFEVWRDRETEILRVSNTGEFLWHKDAEARIANPGPDANPAMMHLFRALRRAEVVQAENERLREALDRSLTDEQIRQIAASIDRSMPLESAKILFARRIEAALRREEVQP